jgi:hypothetical protein
MTIYEYRKAFKEYYKKNGGHHTENCMYPGVRGL